MPERAPDTLLDGGPTAWPRLNGELVFEEPWQARVFGLTLALHQRGAFDWEEFRARLIREVAAREGAPGAAWSYYACWLAALEGVLVAKGVCGAAELGARVRALAARPHGHDHRT